MQPATHPRHRMLARQRERTLGPRPGLRLLASPVIPSPSVPRAHQDTLRRTQCDGHRSRYADDLLDRRDDQDSGGAVRGLRPRGERRCRSGLRTQERSHRTIPDLTAGQRGHPVDPGRTFALVLPRSDMLASRWKFGREALVEVGSYLQGSDDHRQRPSIAWFTQTMALSVRERWRQASTHHRKFQDGW